MISTNPAPGCVLAATTETAPPPPMPARRPGLCDLPFDPPALGRDLLEAVAAGLRRAGFLSDPGGIVSG